MGEEISRGRRTVVVGGALGAFATVVAACGSSTTTSAGSEAATASPSDAPAPASGSALAKTSAVPVGSGLIVGDVVITQPTAGVFQGFSSVCPHAGCHVSKVADGKIVCPCHGSLFNLDGSVDKGPAKQSLESKSVIVQGDSIIAG